MLVLHICILSYFILNFPVTRLTNYPRIKPLADCLTNLLLLPNKREAYKVEITSSRTPPTKQNPNTLSPIPSHSNHSASRGIDPELERLHAVSIHIDLPKLFGEEFVDL